ncbi:MAG: M1 family peptidase, partial [Chloroflexi bacterium]
PRPSPSASPPSAPVPGADFSAAADEEGLESFPRYDLAWEVDPTSGLVAGQMIVRYPWAGPEPLSDLVLRLFPNAPAWGGTLTVTQAQINGHPVRSTLTVEGTALRLSLPAPLPPGQSVTATTAFTLQLPPLGVEGNGQLGYGAGRVALAEAYPMVPCRGAEGWWEVLGPAHGDVTCNPVAFYRVQITAPATMTPLTSGRCDPPLSLGGGMQRWLCTAGPVRDFAAFLGADYQVVTTSVEGVTVRSASLPGDEAGGREALDDAAYALALFQRRFGPYPYAELDVVEGPLDRAGMEYPGLVLIQAAYYGEKREGLEPIVVHEVAHQWWYGLVGNDQVNAPWLDEALAEFSTLLYYEDRYGEEEAGLIEESWRQSYEAVVAAGQDRPVGLPADAYPQELYGPLVYRKGALFLVALRETIGDDAFEALLRQYLVQHRYGLATPEDFRTLIEGRGGPAAGDLYEAWILGTRHP